MSFQGDVRGIGLAELLQGLARGRKEGILTLTSQEGLRSVLGLLDGKAYLLPDPDENPEMWRDRVRDAWADDPACRVDYLRMSEVAHATRLEILYRLLDGGGVHFRFEPGDLPDMSRPDPSAEGDFQVHSDGILVEFLLLEYARVADELEGVPEVAELPLDVVAAPLDPSLARGTPPRFLEQIDGYSTLLEISDRLGWPIRQTRLTLAAPLRCGALRLVHPNELLGLAYEELRKKNFSRAARRLTAWTRDGMPGPLAPDQAEALATEWISGRLTAALRGMQPRRVRTLLRRLDHSLRNPSTSVVHWTEAQRIHRTDRLSRMHRMAAEFREGGDPERPGVRELLDMAREFSDAGFARRAAPLLVMAAHQQPEAMNLQLELGLGLVNAGRATEGAAWVVAGAREMLERGQSDRAVAPLRTLLEANPRHREGRALLSRARRTTTGAKKLRKNLLISLAGVILAAGGAVVKVHRDQTWQTKVDDVRRKLGDPNAALVTLNTNFPGSEDPEVMALRAQIEDQQRVHEVADRNAWLEDYSEAQVEARKGDPLVALDKVRTLPQPPHLKLIKTPWPLRGDIYESMLQHFDDQLVALGPPVEDNPSQVRREKQLDEQAGALLASLTDAERSLAEVQSLIAGLGVVQERIRTRSDERDAVTERRLERENLREQDRLLREAEQYAKNGDFERALNYYEKILALDHSGEIRAVLQEQYDLLREQNAAVEAARALAKSGQHTAAHEELTATFEDPDSFMLPWKVESFPTGARVELDNGRLYTTPFEIETTFGQKVVLTITADGFEPRRIESERPADRFVFLSRIPERSWKGSGRIDAIPVSVEDDHVVVDRQGDLARLGPGGQLRWQQPLQTLSGIARAPVFVPGRKGQLLLVTEDGAAWFVDIETGRLEGPWDLGSPPQVGPVPTGRHVRLRLADKRVALWKEGLKPVVEDELGDALGSDNDYLYGSDCGMQVARRRAGHPPEVASRFNDWVVTAEDEVYRVHRVGRENEREAYTVVRRGDWEFLAWEAPTSRAPYGRLWISDGAGVRAFEPTE